MRELQDGSSEQGCILGLGISVTGLGVHYASNGESNRKENGK